jgi:hypothetical protein
MAMQLQKCISGLLGVIIFFSISTFAQTSKLSIGMDYGSGIIQPSAVLSYNVSVGVYSFINWTAVPKQIRGLVSVSLNPYHNQNGK